MTLAQILLQFVRQHRGAYIASAGMLTGVAIFTVWIPRKVGAVVDGLAAQRLSQSALLVELLTIILFGLAIYLLRVGWRLQLFSAAYLLGVELRTRIYARLMLQGPRFYQQQRTGDLMALATNDIDAVEMAAGEAMLAEFDGSLTLVMVLAMMTLAVDWRLALVALLPFPFMAFAFWRISGEVHKASRDSLDCFSNLNDHVQETLSGVRTVRALGLEKRAARQFADLAEAAADAAYRAQKWEAAYEPAVGFTLTVAGALTLAVGGYMVWHGRLTIGGLTTFTIYLTQLIWPMFAAGWVLSIIQRGRAAWARIYPVINEAPSIDDHGTIQHLAPDTITLERVDFSYPGQTIKALAEVSLKLAPGRTLGIVGPPAPANPHCCTCCCASIRPLPAAYAGGSMRWMITR